jgi:CheY-like chemotaxis protein/anti-sigma regulatory factor (Ser/Thr protein kinase)
MAKNDNQLRIERGDALGTVHQDLTKLRQSLLNLLSNAAKFTNAGTVTLGVVRSREGDGDWLTISVRDSGIGIPADKLDRVFEEFGQAEETTSRDYGGTGLGLPISHRFCRLLGGDLTVASRPGEGSTFMIRVPAVLPQANVREDPTPAPTRSDAEIADLRRTGAGRVVLVIDDDPASRDIVERLLRQQDFEVVTAATGDEGLQLAHELDPAVITLDVMMPDMDGWAVLRALKADPALRDVPVVMLTVLDDEARGYTLGATDYLMKPVDRDALLAVIARYAGPDAARMALLVDDDASVREPIARALRISGWEVAEAENGQAALERLAEARPNLILLDLMMPVMDGFDFLVELHASADWREIPVVVLTSKDLTLEDRRVLSGRVEQILAKDSWSHEQLVGLVQKLAAGRDEAA